MFRNDGEKLVPLTRNGKAVGKVWKAWQNVDALSYIDELFQTQEGKIEVCGALGNGEKVWVLARMPNNIVLDGVDTITQFLLITNTHDCYHAHTYPCGMPKHIEHGTQSG